ncbi:Ureidoacrylate amidohydrolase RutB [Durusdinium trenchii]|uniref:Ureidoacrylate amidohydrolase RutB n=1 Tax=Durusdinium trenchii TaxID=1381693 RepID=A0ABP0P857_9DINO
MVPNISQLLAAARRADVEIIYTVIEALTLDGRDLSLDYKLSGPLFVPKGHPDAAVLPDIRPDSDDIILPKTSCSVFCSTNINYVLRNLGTRYLIVCGQLTNQCVESAVRDAADLGFLVTVPEDACAAKSAAEHSSGLFNMRGFARVVSTAELRLELLKQVQDKQSLATVSSPPKRSICYLNVAYDELYGANVPGMMMEMFGDVGAGNFDLHTCNVKTDAFPVHDQFDGFIIMGSLSSCAASSKHDSWLPRLLGFLQLLVREERPLVGICFGHQAIALALGGTVIVNPAGTQRGLQSYPTTEDSRLRLDLPEECTSIFSHHGDAVVLLPKQAISWGYCHSGHWGMTLKKCLTTQAHPEFSTKTGLRALRALLEKDRKSISCQTGWVQGSPVEELDQQISLLDRPTDYKNFAVAFARVLGLLPETGWEQEDLIRRCDTGRNGLVELHGRAMAPLSIMQPLDFVSLEFDPGRFLAWWPKWEAVVETLCAELGLLSHSAGAGVARFDLGRNSLSSGYCGACDVLLTKKRCREWFFISKTQDLEGCGKPFCLSSTSWATLRIPRSCSWTKAILLYRWREVSGLHWYQMLAYAQRVAWSSSWDACEVDEDQEAAISWAAEKANWQLLRFSLGWVSEFTSKIVSRIKLWHASGGLLPVVGGLLCIERGTVHWQPPADADGFLQESYGDYGWPSPKKVDSFEPGLGPRIHFVVHVQLQLKEMKIGDWSPAHSLVARCCLAALWRAHGAYYRCLVAFVFLPDGQGATPVVTVSRKFAGRFMGKAATEHEVLVALCAAIDDAKQRPCTKQKPVKWAVCVRWPETQAAWKTVVAYPKDSVVELVIRGSSCSEKSSGNVLYLASADSGIDVLVVHVLKRHTHLSDALHAVLQPAVVATNSAEVICILQSALLDTGLNYYELARQFDFQAQEFASVGWYKIYGCLMSQYLNAA